SLDLVAALFELCLGRAQHGQPIANLLLILGSVQLYERGDRPDFRPARHLATPGLRTRQQQQSDYQVSAQHSALGCQETSFHWLLRSSSVIYSSTFPMHANPSLEPYAIMPYFQPCPGQSWKRLA